MSVDMSVKIEKRVEKSLNRLRAMGLKVMVVEEDPDTALIFITLDSIAKYIEKQITYPLRKVFTEDNYLVIKVWREKYSNMRLQSKT